MAADIEYKRCAQADTRKPGANSRVTAAPPTSSAASRTSTDRPPRARYVAQTSPLWPAPTTMQSYRDPPTVATTLRHRDWEEHSKPVRAGKRHAWARGDRPS